MGAACFLTTRRKYILLLQNNYSTGLFFTSGSKNNYIGKHVL
jgi:hypothetical protein